ncbi:MAG: hypothetical protein ACFE8B_14025 [Candidatus Hermodarchaeota archaeon]
MGKGWDKFKYEQNQFNNVINEEINEQILRGEFKKLNISSILVKSIEESEKKVFEIPPLKFCTIKEKIFESFIKGKIDK